MNQLQQLHEAFELLLSDFIDPREALEGDDGQLWQDIAAGGSAAHPLAAERLADIRSDCRRLLVANEYAINGVENRISYIVGSGHAYQAVVRKHSPAPDSLAAEVQRVLDDFLDTSEWHSRQQEIVRRTDRDGEAFLRLFTDNAGETRVRFIDPEHVRTPDRLRDDPTASHGILTDAADVETVRGYFVDGELLPAEMVQHRRANVDRNAKRGLPLYTPVRKNLRRAEKLLRNMSVVAEIQSAIALIRKHRAATRTGVEQFVASSADATVAKPTGRIEQLTQYGAGTILDAPAHVEYDFPATGVDASAFVAILQAELRAIAARLVMPEFMFTSDASNANYSSTMVAEGPAVRMFERLQATMARDDRDIMWRVVQNAAAAGKLPTNIRALIDIQITPPALVSRDALDDARVMDLAYRRGIVSPQTWTRQLGLDYEQEQKNRAMHGGE
ncbi:phage portal protein [Aeoliella sp.]|uniref:phage portal protein n=1 Tax=Aeoliella sp. TaxID=2795800 RepID=UPI003CCBC256